MKRAYITKKHPSRYKECTCNKEAGEISNGSAFLIIIRITIQLIAIGLCIKALIIAYNLN